MKPSILIIILLIPCLAIAQKSPTISFLEKYSQEKGYTSVYITKHTFEFFAEMENGEEAKAFKESVSSLNSIKVLHNDLKLDLKENPFYTDLLPSLSKYKEILMYKEDGQFVKIFTYEVDSKIKEFVVINYGSTENIMVIMEGEDINKQQLSILPKTMKIDGIEPITRIK